ncbi:MAG: 50S ribosomal protein L25 [Deltaproteobacteria bacterium]|nr:50S ribosomal protein L25 [Deltaproteobacteria bacterium]
MEFQVVSVRDRPVTGKGVARKIRALGHIPAVLYGKGMEPRSLVVEPKQLVSILQSPRGSNTVVKLEMADGSLDCLGHAMIKAHAVHPFRRHLMHCDFIRVDEKAPLKLDIPILVVGRSEGEKAGANLNVQMRTIALTCQPSDVPDHIEVDVTALDVGDGLMVSDLTLPSGTKPVHSQDMQVVTVRMGRVEEEEVEEEIEEGLEGEAAEGAVAAGEEGAATPTEGQDSKTDTPEG